MHPSTSIAKPSLVHLSVTVRHFNCWPIVQGVEHEIVAPHLVGARWRLGTRTPGCNPLPWTLPCQHRCILRRLNRLISRCRACHSHQRASPPLRQAFAYRICHLGTARSPLFCGDFLHHLDLEIALRQQFLQPRILGLKLLQALNCIAPKCFRHV